MRVAFLALLALVLLAVLCWHRGEPVAQSGTMNAPASAPAPHAPAQEARTGSEPTLVLPQPLAREPIEEPAVVASTSAPGAPKATLHGRLVDPLGRGVAGTVHVLKLPRGTGGIWRTQLRSPTADDGGFSLDLCVGTSCAMLGMAKGFAASHVQTFEVIEAQPPASVTLCLQSYTEIRGVVVDEHDAPRRGNVFLGLPASTDVADMARSWSGMAWLEATQRRELSWKAECAEDGSFVFPSVMPDYDLILTYAPDELEAAFVQWRHISPGDRALRLVARSDDLRCGSVAGTVTDAEGAPLTSYQIQVDGRFWKDIKDPEGRFEVRAQWGCEAPILVRMDGSAPVHCVGRCRIDRDTQQHALQLLPPGELTVRVHDRDGRAVVQAAVQIEVDMGATRGASVWQPFGGFPTHGETAANGEAHLSGLGAGPYRVRVFTNGRLVDTLTTVRSGAKQSVDVVVATQ